MSLPLPKLDNYTFDELTTEAQALIPRYAPAWTDHNAHDPGITLIELFAWLAEMESYRLDRVTDASARAFLRLVGIEPKPAQVAETVFALTRTAVTQPAIPARTKLLTAPAGTNFQTTHSVWVSRSKLVAVLAGSKDTVVDLTPDNTPSDKRFMPFGADAQIGDALYLGCDLRLSVAPERIYLYVWCGDPETDRQTKQALVHESKLAWQAAKKRRRPVWNCSQKGTRPSYHSLSRCNDISAASSWRRHYSVRTVWEYYAGSDQWLPLTDVCDRTRALTLSGAVRFTAPDPAQHGVGGVSSGEYSKLFFIRCRIVSGHFDCAPKIRLVQLNTVRSRHAVDSLPKKQPPAKLTDSNGRAGQSCPLGDSPIVPGSTQLEVRLKGTVDCGWQEHLSWDCVGPHDRSYVLDAEHGELSFGNGRAGAVPKAGAAVLVRYQIGAGPTGNVAAGTKWTTDLSVDITQSFAASGGAAAESLFDAKARAVAWLSGPHRAVTLDDFEQLALATPGVPIARATALADYDPKLTCVTAPGCVTVVVVPRCAPTRPNPGPDLLRAVGQYLERRRMLTTEVHVIGPEYAKVAVHATLHAVPGTLSRELIAAAIDSLNQYFDPISGGPEGNGWPMGRAVYRAEVLARLNALPGVLYVDELTLETVVETPKVECDCCHKQEKTIPAQCGNIEICPHGLVISGQHQIKVAMERTV